MTPADYERYFHLSASLRHLEAARLPHLASDVRAELALLEQKAERARRESHRRSFAPALSVEDVEEMAAFGVRFGAIHWIPSLMNLREYDLPLVRSFEALADRPRTTGRTRRFAQALRSDPDRILERGWTGFMVQIEIAHAEEDFDFIPHWSDSVQIPVYVQRLDQAIRIARVLRDRELLKNGPVPDRNLWTRYVRHGRRWDLPDSF
jgi:hypothetical protein